MPKTYNLYKSKCKDFKRNKLLGYSIPTIIDRLYKEGSLEARILSEALSTENHNTEAKYHRYAENNMSKANRSYFLKDEGIRKLIALYREYNSRHRDRRLRYGYYKDSMGPDDMVAVFFMMPGSNKPLSFHTEMEEIDAPICFGKDVPKAATTNKGAISSAIVKLFSDMFPRRACKNEEREKYTADEDGMPRKPS